MKAQQGPKAATVGSWLAAGTMSAALAAITGCWGRGPSRDDPARMTIELRSESFAEGGSIPAEFTCDGANGSPPLEWSKVPPAAKELALICEDPDAPLGTFTHWVVVGLPPTATGLRAGVPAGATIPPSSLIGPVGDPVPARIRQGTNDFGKLGYGGPCPPSGTHHYIFRLYALDTNLAALAGRLKSSDVLAAVKGHVLAEGRLTGKYKRSR